MTANHTCNKPNCKDEMCMYPANRSEKTVLKLTTMNTKQTECCEKCKLIQSEESVFETYYCANSYCPCHKETHYETATPEEKAQMMREIAQEANEAQRKVVEEAKETDTVEAIVEELQKCPDCKGEGTTDCDHCEPGTHDCSRCLGGGKLYSVDIEAVRQTLTTLTAQNQRKVDEAVEAERKRLRRYVGIRFLKTREAIELQNEIYKALTPQPQDPLQDDK